MVDVAEQRVQGEFGIDAVADRLSGLWRLAAAAPRAGTGAEPCILTTATTATVGS